MKAIRTYKLKITTENSIFQEVTANYKLAANWLSNIIFKNGLKTSNRLQKEFYPIVREKFQLPSQVACNLFRQVVSTYKSMKSKGEWLLAIYKKNVCPLVWKRDFNWTKNKLTIWGKVTNFLSREISGTWKDSKLKLIGKTWYLLLTTEIDVPDLKTTGTVVGVDSGQKNLLTAVDKKTGKTLYISGNVLNHRRHCIRQTKARVASVGSRSAHRLLQRLSGREKAVTHNLLHVASKQLVTFAKFVGAKLVVMEDLTGIRSNKKCHHKQRTRNHRWPYAQAQFYIDYKLAGVGIGTEYVSPAYTSQTCPACGHCEKANRNGLEFRCRSCNHRDNADRNGGVNISSRSLLFWGNPGMERVACQSTYSSDEGDLCQSATSHGACPRGH